MVFLAHVLVRVPCIAAPTRFRYVFCLSHYERLRVLCAQLLRATNPEVVQVVADELKDAVDA
jgi:hypothetical protein